MDELLRNNVHLIRMAVDHWLQRAAVTHDDFDDMEEFKYQLEKQADGLE